jgi:hypothetical protein
MGRSEKKKCTVEGVRQNGLRTRSGVLRISCFLTAVFIQRRKFMGYSHMFFAVDVAELKGLYGSKNDALLNEVLNSQTEEIEDNDAFFEDEIADGELPDTATAVREIFHGTPRSDVDGAIYGYALKIICQHIGQAVWGGENGVANVADHPYDSLLVKSGLPIPIPEPGDFPVIGYLDFDQLDQELILAKADHKKVASDSAEAMSAIRGLMNAMGLGIRSGRINAQDIQEDIDAYIETLESAKKLGKGLVSFRH